MDCQKFEIEKYAKSNKKSIKYGNMTYFYLPPISFIIMTRTLLG